MNELQRGTEVGTQMPKYRCFKEVWALRINKVEDNGTDTTTDENPIVTVHFDGLFLPRKMNLRGKPTPAPGWYMVQYEDGYISFSPGQQFEEGYMPVALIPREPKTFEDKIRHAINSHSMENGSATPDFVLADYLQNCLNAYNTALKLREKWYGREINEIASTNVQQSAQTPGAKARMKRVCFIGLCLLGAVVPVQGQSRTINFTQEIKSLDGTVMMQCVPQAPTCEKPVAVTLGDLAVNALQTPMQEDQKLSGEDKFRMYLLAVKIYKAKSASLTAEEIKLVKDRIGKQYSVVAMGTAWQMLSGGGAARAASEPSAGEGGGPKQAATQPAAEAAK
jgi:hypothetical protein